MGKITEITEKHLYDGKLKNSQTCPIALALTDNDYIDVNVYRNNIIFDQKYIDEDESVPITHEDRFVVKYNEQSKENDKRIKIRIARYDAGLRVKPFKIIEKLTHFEIYEE